VLAVGILLPLYFLLGGLDWILAWRDVVACWEQQLWQDGAVETGLYIVRHVMLYVALSKYLLKWNTNED
jgi:hypothetical protein